MDSTYFPSIVTNIFCIVFVTVIFFHLERSLGTEHEVRELRNMIFSYYVMQISDIFYVVAMADIIAASNIFIALSCAVSNISTLFGCYFWFRFIDDRLSIPIIRKRWVSNLFICLLIVTSASDIFSIFTGLVFSVDKAGNYSDGPLYFAHAVVDYIYLVIPTVYAIHLALHTRMKYKRSEYLTYSGYMVAPLLAGILEDKFQTVPILSLNILVVILILFLTIQNMQIYNDALTGLNNRRCLQFYLAEKLPKATNERQIIIFMIDINRFKFINDTYGHLEGDHCLKMFADVMKDFARKNCAFVARYGGDEFCAVMNSAKLSPQEIADDFLSMLSESKCVKNDSKYHYELTASIGWTVCSGQESDASSIISQADKELYEKKRAWHKLNS